MKTKIIILLTILAVLLLVTLTLALLILVKAPILVIPFIGLMTIAMTMTIISFALNYKSGSTPVFS